MTRPIFTLATLALCLLLSCLKAAAQVAIPVGAGSYASFVPSFDAQADEYYGLGPQQIIDLYPNLHLDPSLTNRPLPSNKWWTDVLIGDRSGFNSTNNPPRTVVQNPFGGNLWAFPVMLAPRASGFNLYFPNSWNPGDPPTGGFATGNALPITGSTNSGAAVFTALNSVVTDWSDWGFQFKLPDANGNYMKLTLARGVPFVWMTCSGVNPRLAPGAVTLYDTNNTAISTSGGLFAATAFAFDFNGRSYGVFAPDNTTFRILTGNVIEAQLSGTNNYLIFGLLPARTNLGEFAQYAYAQVTGTRMDWVYDRTNGQVQSTWTLTTTPLKNGQTNTLQGWLPHHYRTTQNNLAFKPYTYLTPRGLMKVAAGTQFQINYAFHGIAPVLPAPHTNGLTNDYVQSRMQTYVQNFANAGHPTGDETYGAGKDLGVTAQYMTFAHQMGLTSAEGQLKNALENRLQDWYTYTPGEAHHFFALYTNWPALLGFDVSYGSQAFNDNHFHYGYFMVATALVGLSDPAWLSQYGPMAELVAKEYANWDRTDLNFPFFRTFDIWEGHSWAGGTSSGGGENQESSSEAMNSWVGLFLLGNALNDDAITAAGAMGYAMESTAVNEYWQDMYRTNFPTSYGKTMNGILGAGSLAFATYFDGDPAWVYGIQMVPQNHWNNYLVRNKAHAFYQFTNLWNDRIIWQPPWTNTASYNSGNWVRYNGYIWSANTNLAPGQPAPGQPGALWSEQANISTSTASDLGGYLGNYILGWELLFNPDDVAALFDASYASGGAISSDGTYSGITYYLTHALRGLGDPDTNYYTSLPTSQIYFNPNTGIRTAIIYNPSAISQTATIYNQGVAQTTLTVQPGTLTVHASPVPGSFEPTLARNAQLSWPTTIGNSYKVQWTTSPTNGATWTDLTGLIVGNGATDSLFDPAGADGSRAYRALEYTTVTVTNIVNGSFEAGTGTNAANWTSSGSEPPFRVNTNAHSGNWSMMLANTNKATGGIQFQQDENKQGAPAVIPGLSYTFSFWAQQILNGLGLVQNYKLTWLDGSSATISSINANFVGGGGYWNQIIVPGLVPPANAVEARFTFSSTTGATAGSAGEVLIDDVLLTTSAPGSTNVLAVAVQPGWQIAWPSANYVTYGLQRTETLGSTNPWTDFGTTFSGTGSILSVFDPSGTNQFRFYRVYAQP